MVYQIIKSKLGLFIEAFVLAVLILLIGFTLGFLLESHRLNSIVDEYKEFEVQALDLKLKNYYYQIMDDASCREAINQNLFFADKIYDQGLVIQKYEDSGELLLSSILTEKKKQVLLKAELWLNSIMLKKKCVGSFHTVVYFYSQNPNSVKEAEQAAISKILKEIKEEKGNSIILIPIAGDLGLDAVDLQLKVYNITYFPTILIDEKVRLEGFKDKEEISSLLV
jgi:hypothetical protein